MIAITSLSKAKKIKRDYGAIITIEDPGIRAIKRLRFHNKPHPPQLVLRFEDVDRYDEGLATPDIHHVAAALSFAEANADKELLVHCHQGVCRSTALGLAIYAQRLGAGREQEAVKKLLETNPDAAPTLCMIEMADELLNRNGHLVAAWSEMESLPNLINYRARKIKLLKDRREIFALRPQSGYHRAVVINANSLVYSSFEVEPQKAFLNTGAESRLKSTT
jgi:predicted protein tyrosine phosphatase